MHLNFVFRQVVAMLGAVVVSFFVCLLPYRLLSLFQESEGISPEIFYMLVNFCRVMVYLNSAINPILYNLMSSKFRNGFLRLFGLKGFARQGTVTSSSMTNTNTTSTTASSSNAVAQANASLAHHGTLSLHRPLHYRLSSQQPTWSINPPHFVCRWYAHKWALTNLNSKHTIYFLFHVSFWHDIHTRVACKVVVKQHIFYLRTAWWLFYVVLFCLTNNQFFGVNRFFIFFILYFLRYNICMCACIFVKWPRAGGYNRYFAHHANHPSFHWWQESERICSPALFEKGKEGYVFCFVIFYTSKIMVLYTFVSSYSIILKKISSFFFMAFKDGNPIPFQLLVFLSIFFHVATCRCFRAHIASILVTLCSIYIFHIGMIWKNTSTYIIIYRYMFRICIDSETWSACTSIILMINVPSGALRRVSSPAINV